tara:strand:- start:3863 stop:4381 length:519 start_codon:yes stop_codon:yes gene_type:complete
MVFLSGCVNSSLNNRKRITDPSILNPAANFVESGDTVVSGGYECPQSDNVKPVYDPLIGGAGNFYVCTNQQTPTTIRVEGTTDYSNTICVYPAQESNGQLSITLDQSNGGVAHLCVPMQSETAYFSFPNMNFNRVFIVESQNETKMNECLSKGNYGLCPQYPDYFSYGWIIQ